MDVISTGGGGGDATAAAAAQRWLSESERSAGERLSATTTTPHRGVPADGFGGTGDGEAEGAEEGHVDPEEEEAVFTTAAAAAATEEECEAGRPGVGRFSVEGGSRIIKDEEP